MPTTKLYLQDPQPLENGVPVPLKADARALFDKEFEVKENKRGEQYVEFGQMMRFDELASRGLGGVPFSRCVMYLSGQTQPHIAGLWGASGLGDSPPLGIYNYSDRGLYGEVFTTSGWVARATGKHLGQTHDFLHKIYKKKIKPTRTWRCEYRKFSSEFDGRKTLREKVRDRFRPEPEILWD